MPLSLYNTDEKALRILLIEVFLNTRNTLTNWRELKSRRKNIKGLNELTCNEILKELYMCSLATQRL